MFKTLILVLIFSTLSINQSIAREIISLGKVWVSCDSIRNDTLGERITYVNFAEPMFGTFYGVKVVYINENNPVHEMSYYNYNNKLTYHAGVRQGLMIYSSHLPARIKAKCDVGSSQAFILEGLWEIK